ncbi:MAG: AMP-binding protein [Pseudomonadota bacterium]
MYEVELEFAEFAAQRDDTVEQTTVGGVLRAAAARAPDAIALVEADIDGQVGRQWSYQALLGDAERLAQALLSKFEPGERIAIWSPNIPEWVLLEYASALAGLTLVTVNPAYQPKELKYVLEQSGAVGLFLVKEFRGNPMGEIAQEVCAEIGGKIRYVVDLEDEAALFAGSESGASLPDVQPEDPVQIQYTSGTTGFPKGAVLHHLGLTNNSRMVFKRLKAQRGDTVLNFMPMFHTAGCAILTLGSAQFDCRMIIAKLFDPSRMLALIESERVDFMFGVPTMLIGLSEAQATAGRDVSSVRMACSGGSMVPPELVRRIRATFGCDFETVYGQTETSPVLTQTRADDTLDDLCNTVGQALPQIEMSIRDPNTNAPVAIDEVGEICARGYCNMIGYNNNPDATAATIDAEGWLHTGDLGAMDARGYVRVTGRVKEMIIRGGENLFPAEIENTLLEHPDVAEVAVVGVPDDRWGEIVACFIRLSAGAGLDRDALSAHCRAHMSPQKTPARWIEVSDWPLTGSGKIQKFVLRDRFVEGAYEHAS